MRDQIRILFRLQTLDKEEIALKERLAALPNRIDELKEQVMGERKRLEELAQNRASSQQRMESLHKEAYIYEEEAKKREKRLYSLKSDDVFRVLMREIQNLKKGKKMLEEEASRLQEEFDQTTQEMEALSQRVDRLEKELQTSVGMAENERQEVQERLRGVTSQIKNLKGQLSLECHRHYELIRSRSLLPIVVQASNGVCRGCYMSIPPQLFNRVQANKELVVCPSCHRILYFDKDGELDMEDKEVMLSM